MLDCIHAAVESVARVEAHELSVFETTQPFGRADPECAVCVLEQSFGAARRESVARREVRERARVVTTQAAGCSDPDVARAGLVCKLDIVARQTLLGGVCVGLTIGEPNESFRRAQPERAPFVLHDGAHVVALELRRVLLVEDDEAEAVEAREALFGRSPDVAVAHLYDGVDCVLRQSVFGLPNLSAELCEFTSRVECERAPAAEDEQRDEQPCEVCFTLARGTW